MADEVVLVSFGEAPEAVADKIARISVPEGTVLDDAADTVISVFDAEAPAVVLVEPTRHMKTIAGKLAAHANASVITDVMSFENGAVSLYFGGVAERVQKAAGDVAIYTVGAGAFEGAEASGANAVEDVAWVAPATPVKLVSSTRPTSSWPPAAASPRSPSSTWRASCATSWAQALPARVPSPRA